LRTFVDEDKVVYASYDNSNFRIPFFVAVDQAKEKIVICARGSFSCVDWVIDGICTPVEFDVPGVPENLKVSCSVTGSLACGQHTGKLCRIGVIIPIALC